MNNKFKIAIEIIGQAIHDFMQLSSKNKKNKPYIDAVNELLEAANNGYLLVQWPDSQNYMEEEWFEEEAIFCGGSEEKTGSSAYFIPIKRIL